MQPANQIPLRLSRIPGVVAGGAAIAALAMPRMAQDPAYHQFADTRSPWTALFLGVALTSIGSAYYHFAPDNWTLVWDRLPMTVGVMGLLTAVLAERVSSGDARALFVPLLVFGAVSVFYWYWSEVLGARTLVSRHSIKHVVAAVGLYW